MIPRFALARPDTLQDAFEAFDAAGGDAAWFAGGTELLQVMKMGFAQFDTLIDLKRIPDLHGIAADADGWLVIGAATTHREIERSPLVAQRAAGLAALASRVANVRVRNTGTLGGNLAFAEPHSDPATFLLACGATIRLAGPRGTRELPIGEFVLGPLFTAREPDEIVVSVRIPPAASGEGRGYDKIAFFERPAASVAARLIVEGGAVTAATVAVGSLTEVPTLVPAAAERLVGAAAEEGSITASLTAAAETFETLEIVPDLNGSVDYKRHLATLLLGNATRAALREALAHG